MLTLADREEISRSLAAQMQQEDIEGYAKPAIADQPIIIWNVRRSGDAPR
jgi:hypothetical protein